MRRDRPLTSTTLEATETTEVREKMLSDLAHPYNREGGGDIVHRLTVGYAPTDLIQPGTAGPANAFSRVWRRYFDAQRPPVPVQRRVRLDQEFELFRDVEKREFRRIKDLFTVREVPQGHILASQGDPAREFFLLLQGRVAISIDGVPDVVLDEGCHFGEIPLLDLGAGGRLASAHTLEASCVAVANRREFRAMLDNSPTVARRVTMLALDRQAYVAAVKSHQTLGGGAEYPRHLVST